MRGRPTIHDHTELILKAQDLFWRKGYTATSLTDLLEITGAGSGSFYNSFKGGKKQVLKEAILKRRQAFNDFKTELEKSNSPIELIKSFFRSISEESEESHSKGCIIANTVVEMSDLDEELEQEAVKILKEVEQMFTEAILKSQQKGDIKNKTEASILGKYLITFWCGLNTLRRIYPDRTLLSQQIEIQLAVIS